MRTWFFHLQTVHSSLSTSFLVVLAFFLRMGLDWPPKPCCLRSYLRSRAASRHGVTRRHDPRVTARDKCDKMICDDFIPTSALGILGLSGLLVLGHLQSECIADTIVRYYKNAMHLP